MTTVLRPMHWRLWIYLLSLSSVYINVYSQNTTESYTPRGEASLVSMSSDQYSVTSSLQGHISPVSSSDDLSASYFESQTPITSYDGGQQSTASSSGFKSLESNIGGKKSMSTFKPDREQRSMQSQTIHPSSSVQYIESYATDAPSSSVFFDPSPGDGIYPGEPSFLSTSTGYVPISDEDLTPKQTLLLSSSFETRKLMSSNTHVSHHSPQSEFSYQLDSQSLSSAEEITPSPTLPELYRTDDTSVGLSDNLTNENSHSMHKYSMVSSVPGLSLPSSTVDQTSLFSTHTPLFSMPHYNINDTEQTTMETTEYGGTVSIMPDIPHYTGSISSLSQSEYPLSELTIIPTHVYSSNSESVDSSRHAVPIIVSSSLVTLNSTVYTALSEEMSDIYPTLSHESSDMHSKIFDETSDIYPTMSKDMASMYSTVSGHISGRSVYTSMLDTSTVDTSSVYLTESEDLSSKHVSRSEDPSSTVWNQSDMYSLPTEHLLSTRVSDIQSSPEYFPTYTNEHYPTATPLYTDLLDYYDTEIPLGVSSSMLTYTETVSYLPSTSEAGYSTELSVSNMTNNTPTTYPAYISSSSATTEQVSSFISTTFEISTPKYVYMDKKFVLTFNGECEPLVTNRETSTEFQIRVQLIVSEYLEIDPNDVYMDRLSCGSVKSYFLIYNSTQNYSTSLSQFVTTGELLVEMTFPESNQTVIFRAYKVRELGLTETGLGDEAAAVDPQNLSEKDIILIVLACCICVILVVIGVVVCARRVYSKKYAQSFNLMNTPHSHLKMEEFTLTQFPRQRRSYAGEGVQVQSYSHYPPNGQSLLATPHSEYGHNHSSELDSTLERSVDVGDLRYEHNKTSSFGPGTRSFDFSSNGGHTLSSSDHLLGHSSMGSGGSAHDRSTENLVAGLNGSALHGSVNPIYSGDDTEATASVSSDPPPYSDGIQPNL